MKAISIIAALKYSTGREPHYKASSELGEKDQHIFIISNMSGFHYTIVTLK